MRYRICTAPQGASSLREDAELSLSPATPHLPYPPASRGRERNFPIPLLRVRGRTRVRHQRTTGVSLMLVRRGAADPLFGALPHMHRPTGGVRAPRGRGTQLITSNSPPSFTRPRPAGGNGIGIFKSPYWATPSTMLVSPNDVASSGEKHAAATIFETTALCSDAVIEVNVSEATNAGKDCRMLDRYSL